MGRDGPQRAAHRGTLRQMVRTRVLHPLRCDFAHPTRFRYPVILDAAVQSNGLGFVGTDRSTFSILSRRRVIDWHDGAARMVLWGSKGADDH